MQGVIIKGIGGFYYIKKDQNIYCCKARGIFRKEKITPLVGDKVVFTPAVDEDNEGIIEEILSRKNHLTRPAVANIDKLFIVIATINPSPNTLIIDKTIAAAEIKNIEPIVVLTKNDLHLNYELEKIYKKAGIKFYSVSYEENFDFTEIYHELENSISAFTGNTGVGKSTLLNALFPNLELETGIISKKLGRGKHTTRHVELFEVADNSFVADTPGFSTMDLERYQLQDKDELVYGFREFKDYIFKCKFTSCTHTCEKSCAILEAVENGDIHRSRIESYISMYNEIKDVKQWQKPKNV